MKQSRDEAAAQIEHLADSQRKLYEDNIEKLRELQKVEMDIVENDRNIILLNNIVELLKERINFDVKDLDERIRELEDDIVTIDHGTKRMDAKVDYMKNILDNPTYQDSLSRIQDKIQKLNSKNNENNGRKDKLRTDVLEHESTITKIDPQNLSIEDIQRHKRDLHKIESNIETAEGIKSDHMKEFHKLINELGELRSDIENEYERNIKQVQKRDEEWVDDTTKNLNDAKDMLEHLKSQIEDDNPFMKRFIRKLNNAKDKLNELKDTNNDNKRTMEELASRNMQNEDYLSFIISLAEDQQDSDSTIEETKKSSDDLLKLLSNIKEELDESDKNSKDEILTECKKKINMTLKNLPNLEDKLSKLEKGVAASLRTTDLALQILDKNHSEYEEVSEIDKDMKHLEKDTEGLRSDKNKLTDELEKLKKAIDSADSVNLSMNEVLQIQKQTSKACEDHQGISDGVDSGLDRLKHFNLKLDQLLQSLRDQLKKNTDKLVNDMTDKLEFLQRFLSPEGKVADSIQRPTNLKEVLDDTYILKDDPDYKQYHGY